MSLRPTSVVTNSERQLVVNQLNTRLTELKDKIKKEGVSNVLFDELTSNAKEIQTKLDDIFRKGGIMTDKDADEAIALLEKQRKEELEKQYRKGTTRTIILVLVGALVIGGLFYYVKKTK